MKHRSVEAQPPLFCGECSLGRHAIYGATRCAKPDDVSTRRRSVASYGAQKTFLRQGETVSQIFTLYSGWACQYIQLPDGRRQILSFLVPGDPILLEMLFLPNMPLPFSVKTLTDATVCTFTQDSMRELVRSSNTQEQQVSDVMHRNLARITQRLVDLGRRSALGRLAQLLSDLEERLQSRDLSVNGSFFFPVLQEHMADALGLTPVYVNRLLDRLRQDGVIEFGGRYMTILAPEQLRRIAQEE